jgi:hypothetical protein
MVIEASTSSPVSAIDLIAAKTLLSVENCAITFYSFGSAGRNKGRMDRFIQIRSAKFPIVQSEEEELVNEGTYGKALAEYVRRKLTDRGYVSPFVCCEDWGWWVELSGALFVSGVCIYSKPRDGQLVDFVCACEPSEGRKWSWRKFRFVDTSLWAVKLHNDLLEVFQADEDVQIVGVYNEFTI